MGKLDGLRILEGRSLDLQRFLWDDGAGILILSTFYLLGEGHLSFPHRDRRGRRIPCGVFI
jgi:hypothetical protein